MPIRTEKMMKIKKPLFVLILLVLCSSSATSSFAIDVKIDFDRTTDFGRYKTFCWQKVGTRNPLWIERIRAAVGSALTAKGWSQVESGSACDVAVVAMEIKRNHDTVNTFYDDIGGGWSESTTTTESFQTGTLIVDLFDAKSKNLVWRGSATDTLSKNSDKNIKKLKSPVHKLFEHLPSQQQSPGCCSAAECAAQHHHEAIEGV